MQIKHFILASIALLSLTKCRENVSTSIKKDTVNPTTETTLEENHDRDILANAYLTASSKLQVKTAKKVKRQRPEGFGAYDLKEVETDDGNTIPATKAMVYFLSLLYANENFPVTSDPVKFVANYDKNGDIRQRNENIMVSKIDKDNGRISCDMFNVYTDSDENHVYMNLDINDDFQKSEIKAFTLDMINLPTVEEGFISYVITYTYEDGKLYTLNTNKHNPVNYYETVKNDLYTPYQKKMDQKTITIETDFSPEYTKATDDILGENYF